MDTLQTEQEEKEPSFILNAAVLHIFDYSSGISCFSEETLNIEDAMIEKYVTRHVRRLLQDLRARHGFFNESSEFLGHVNDYAEGRTGFLEFSRRAAGTFDAFLKNLAVHSCDVLFADFRSDSVPYTAMLVLDNQLAYTHSTTATASGKVMNTIVQHHAVLPSASKKLNTYAVINMITREILFADETKWNAGDIQVMQDMVLDCTSEKSGQEVLEEVTEIAGEVAVQFDENPTLLLPKVKQYIRRSSEEEKPLDVAEAAHEIFGDAPAMKEEFLKKTKEKEIPEEVEIPKKAAARKMKNQRIRTDTGIELSFPVEYFENPDLIQFINEPDGTISIAIHRIGKITPRG